MKHDNSRWHRLAERFGPTVTENAVDLLRDARREIDRLDTEIAMLKDSRQAIWNTMTDRVKKLSHLQVAIDRIAAMHGPDDPESDLPYCASCDAPWPCRTAEVIRRCR